MAKVVWKTTPHAAYEWAEVEGGDTMKDYERAALLDDFIADNGLVPVETTFVGEVPTHKYGRYKAASATASALPPPALPTRETDLSKANAENDNLKAEIARLRAQLGKQSEKSKAEVVDGMPEGIGSASVGTTEDAREALNQQPGVHLVGSSEEVREDMSTADRSDDNPKVEPKKAGRPKKDG